MTDDQSLVTFKTGDQSLVVNMPNDLKLQPETMLRLNLTRYKYVFLIQHQGCVCSA